MKARSKKLLEFFYKSRRNRFRLLIKLKSYRDRQTRFSAIFDKLSILKLAIFDKLRILKPAIFDNSFLIVCFLRFYLLPLHLN